MGAHNLGASAAMADVLTDMDWPIDRAGFHESLPLKSLPSGTVAKRCAKVENRFLKKHLLCCAASKVSQRWRLEIRLQPNLIARPLLVSSFLVYEQGVVI